MKTTTFNLLSKTSLQIKHYLFAIVFLFIGLLQVNADCIIDTAATGGDNVMTGTELIAYINDNNCSGTLTIESPVDIILYSSQTIPSSINRIVIKNGGQILWANNNVDLNLQPNAAIVIENTTDIGTTTGALGSTSPTCSNNRAIYIGTIKYSACGGIGNVCVIFSDLIHNGGTIQIDPSFAIIDGTGNEVCFAPTDIEIELNGYYEGTPTYTWSKVSGPGTVTFTPDNDANTTITVSEPGTYVIRITVTVPLSDECLDQFISVYNDLEIEFRDGLGVTTMATTPGVGSGGTCNLNVDFTATTTNGGASLTYSWDFGDGNTSSLQNPSHTYASSDTYNVSLTVTDPDGLPPCNVVVVNEEVVVTDNTPPLINCPNDIIVSNDIDSCGAVVTYTTPVGTDNCTNASTSLIAGLASGSNFPIGTTLVTYEVTDETGNKAQCSFNVTVNDTQDPVITCPANVTADTSNDGEGNCSTTVSLGTPVTNDNCGIKSVVAQVAGVDIDPITFEFDLGETIVTWIVTDNSDRTAACNQTVTVVDDESPRFDAPPTATISCNDDPNDLTLTGTVTRHNIDNCDTTPLDPVYTDSTAPGTCPIITVITRTWAIYDLAGNFHTHTQTINVVPDALVISNVPDETISSGTYTTQEDLDAAFATWLNNFSVSGGCNPSGIFAEQYTAPDLCGGSVDIVYNVTDLCQSGQDIATFTVESANPLIISDIQNLTVNACDFADQTALDTAFANWIAGFNVTGGISPNGQFADQYTAPTLCDGGATAVTYDVTDVCASGQDTATFTVNKPSDLVISDIANQIIPAGTYATQNDLDTAFAAWLNNFTVSGGCNPQATDLSSLTAPDLCGGSVNVVYNVTDLCESGQDVATFTIESSDPLVISDVQDLTVDTCDFADQAALDTAFADWIAGFTVSGGISPNGQFANQYTAPILCDGGATSVTYDVTDLCASGQDTATFTLNAPTAITYTAPVGTDLQSCDYADQTEVSTAFSTWVTAQTNAFAIANGCAPVLTNDSASVTVPELCTGGTATVKWTISDLCETIEVSADFNLTKPAGINHYFPDPVTVSACDFENQEDFDTKFAEWVDAEIIKMDASYEGGCAPFTTHNFTNQTVDICTGGEIVITWLTNDKCEVNHTHTTTYTLTAPPAITYTAPEDADLQSCDYADQTEVSTAFSTWVTAQTNAFAIANGCAPVLTNDSASVTVPELCTGGTATVKWTISDLCETIEVSADFNLTAPTAITYKAPVGTDLQSCDYADQTEVNTAFSTWVTAQTNAFAIANGCAPVLTNDSASVTVPELCTGGAATVKWTISDLCETIEVSADFNLTKPAGINHYFPDPVTVSACDFENQEDFNTKFAEWVDAEIIKMDASYEGGCAPFTTHNFTNQTIDICTGGEIVITWLTNDKCEVNHTHTTTYTLTAPPAITYTAPEDADLQSCDYADQTEVSTAFSTWVTAQTNAFAIANGCAPVLTNDSASVTVPELCTGGTATVKWTISDLCETIEVSADFNLTAPTAITYNAPVGTDLQSCDYTDQTEVNTAFSTWVTAQTNAFAIANGCAPVLTNDSASVTVPELCTGGTATVKWTISDLCETIEVSADFNLTAPTAITYSAPSNDTSVASEFDDPDAAVAQANLDADIAAWITAQNTTITNSVSGGCDPLVTNDYTNQSITFCNSGSIAITWTITDLCETISSITATYTFTQPDGITFMDPSSKTADACDFDNDSPALAQTNLDADIAAWVSDQTAIITNSLTGGSPTVSHDHTDQSIALCDGGSITVNWTIEDICETINRSATYTLNAPTAITYTAPVGTDLQSCDYADQTEVSTAFSTWVTAQTNAFAIANGCSPVLDNDSASVTVPELCTGGTATVKWTISDLCETIEVSADFNLTAPTAITYTAPGDDSSTACEFDQHDAITAQSSLNVDITAWVNNQTSIINTSIEGGCSPIVTNDFASQSIDFCTGGSLTITWQVQDLCGISTSTATYTYTKPTPVAFDQQNLPSNITVECDNIPNANVLTASTNCGEVNVIYNETRINGECASYYELVRTWKATDICGSSVEHTQTITVQDTTPPVLSLPANVSAECSDDLSPIAFGSATATDNCDDNPVISYEDKRTDGACSGTYTITRTWKAIDACGNEATADQVISTSDTTAPEFVETNLPGNVTVECTAVPAAETLTATDNCGTATVTVNDVRADGNCANNYIITRTWTATDECGLTKTHIQTITVQDTTPPTFVETLPPTNLVIECDAVPVAETLTATDSCGSATVSVNDVRTNGSCPNNYTLTRTWTATDECGNTTKHTQIITVQDTKAPQFVEALPNNITVECDVVPTAQTITATDNCGTAMVTVKDIVTNGDCPNNYIIARTWTATDECSNTTEHTQIITVQDTKAPVPAATFDEVLNVSCTNIPQAPALTFTDNCSSAANIVVVFNETSTFQENVYNDYEIVRTWTVRDECANETTYKQTLHVALDEIITDIVADDRCFDDGIVNLNDLIPSALNTNGTWELIEGNPAATLTGSIFNPTTLELGDDFLPDNGGVDYKFRYTTTDNGCISITDVTMNINADCVVLPCGENDVVISKAVTPNGDAYNESFDITGIDLCGFTADVKIFNRWGALIFESNSYTVGENMGEWKGSASKKSVGSASTVPNGTYYYIVTLKDSGLAPFTGPVYLGTK